MKSYFENARDHGFDLDRLFMLLVTEDNCDTAGMKRMLDTAGIDGAVYDETRRESWFDAHGLDQYAHIIPAKSHAQTSFGLLYLWANDQFTRGVFIDDDTRPHSEWDFFTRHLNNLDRDDMVESVRSDEQWVNVLYQHADEHGLYPRGYPYSAMNETVETDQYQVSDVVASQGLWTNVPDLDAVRILMDGDLDGQAQTRTKNAHFDGDFIAAPGQYLTVCSMNLAFEREVIPAFYQLPMDDNNWDVGRFDDIWSGLFLKRAADILGKELISGYPLCIHDKAARSTFDDLMNEAPGLELNEHVWSIIDSAGADATTWTEAATAMAEELSEGNFDQLANGAFLNHCGEYWLDWLDCINKLSERATPIEHAPRADTARVGD
jgi:Reversibly glycosylated polypeptide.